jgi:epoxyqueuosine reductase
MAGRKTGAVGVEPVAAVSLAEIKARAAREYLAVLGGFAVTAADGLPAGVASVLLLGPLEPGYWGHIKAQPEWGQFLENKLSDPVDRWSARVIGGMAEELGAVALFPFGGPPYLPFYSWALRTGRVWESPVKLLVHQDQGLMVSFRGALALPYTVEAPAGLSPCEGCAAPCLTACPAGALTGAGYDVPGCRQFLDGPSGGDCKNFGCGVRRACPVSQGYARLAEQSAYHMGTFHK